MLLEYVYKVHLSFAVVVLRDCYGAHISGMITSASHVRHGPAINQVKNTRLVWFQSQFNETTCVLLGC